MEKVEALKRIEDAWNSIEIDLGDKIKNISNDFYAAGLDLSSTAAYIKATPAELNALLSLGALDEEIIDKISQVNPPKTAWTLIANANEEEITQALNALVDVKTGDISTPISEFVYQQMLYVSGPTPEQRVAMLSGWDLKHALKKGEEFKALSKGDIKFLTGVMVRKRSGKALTDKQLPIVVRILNHLAAEKVIKRNSIDGDEKICNKILDAIGK